MVNLATGILFYAGAVVIPKKLTEEINLWINEKRYGNLQINFSGGKIVNINRVESIKVECLGNVDSVSGFLQSEVQLDS